MKDPLKVEGLSLHQDSIASKNCGVVQAYLLECQLRKILEKEMTGTDYKTLNEKTGISLLELEEAIEDRVYLLNAAQLRVALALHGQRGFIALVHYLHHARNHVPKFDNHV